MLRRSTAKKKSHHLRFGDNLKMKKIASFVSQKMSISSKIHLTMIIRKSATKDSNMQCFQISDQHGLLLMFGKEITSQYKFLLPNFVPNKNSKFIKNPHLSIVDTSLSGKFNVN